MQSKTQNGAVMLKGNQFSGFAVLDVLDKEAGMTTNELYEYVEEVYGGHYAFMELGDVLFSLITLDLVFFEGMTHDKSVMTARDAIYSAGWRLNDQEPLRLRVTPNYVAARTGMMLGINRQRFSISLTPLFGLPSDEQKSDIFSIMAFTEQNNELYNYYLRPISEQLELSVTRADEMLTNNNIIHDIWSGIYNCRLIISECSDHNPNVFYELGICHTIGKETIILLKKGCAMPFDVIHIRYVEYEYSPKGMKILEKRLLDLISSILK